MLIFANKNRNHNQIELFYREKWCNNAKIEKRYWRLDEWIIFQLAWIRKRMRLNMHVFRHDLELWFNRYRFEFRQKWVHRKNWWNAKQFFDLIFIFSLSAHLLLSSITVLFSLFSLVASMKATQKYAWRVESPQASRRRNWIRPNWTMYSRDALFLFDTILIDAKQTAISSRCVFRIRVVSYQNRQKIRENKK